MAIKIISATQVRDSGNNIFKYSFEGLSTDPKPVNPDPSLGIKGIADRSTFKELDTGDLHTYSTVNINTVTGNNWWPVEGVV